MTVIVQRLTDDSEFEEIGRIDNGEIVEGEDALTNIDSQAVWEGMSEGELASRFSGPRIMAGIATEEEAAEGDDDTTAAAAVDRKQTPEGVPEDYEYVAPDEEVGDDYDVVEGPGGATYRSPQPAGDGADDDTAEPDAAGDDPGTAAERADTTPQKATSEEANQAASDMEAIVGDILGPSPGADEFRAAEEYVAAETNVDEVDYSQFDAAQAETASAELARMSVAGELEEIDSFRSQIPQSERSTQGNMPAHYDRDGKGMSVDPNALSARANQRLSEAGVTSTPSDTHIMEHMVGHAQHAANVEAGEAEADPEMSVEEAAEEAGVDVADIASTVGQLAIASTASLVAETYVLARNGYPTPNQIGRLYRFLGGPTLSDFSD